MITKQESFLKKTKIYVAGHRGMVGSAIIRSLKSNSSIDILTKDRSELDLTDQNAVRHYFEKESPDQVYLAAAKVGGIYANNTYPADFIYQNLMISANVIESSFLSGVKKLLFLGSSCIYPRYSGQPIPESALLTSSLEPTNEPYAIAKIAGIKLCESFNRQYGTSHDIDYRSIMPTNLYGPGDTYHPLNSHVIPALFYKFHEGKMFSKPYVNVWGTGKAKREFLHVDDLANACTHLMNLDKESYTNSTSPMLSHINVGSGQEIEISQLALMIKAITGYQGEINYDSTKPDGPERKVVDSTLLINLGWTPKIDLSKGLELTYKDYLNSVVSTRG